MLDKGMLVEVDLPRKVFAMIMYVNARFNAHRGVDYTSLDITGLDPDAPELVEYWHLYRTAKEDYALPPLQKLEAVTPSYVAEWWKPAYCMWSCALINFAVSFASQTV